MNIILINTAIGILTTINFWFGPIGLNAALSSGYIMFEVSQWNTPNHQIAGYKLNHYLWVYILVSMLGGGLGGALHWFHSLCASKEGRDVDKEELLDVGTD